MAFFCKLKRPLKGGGNVYWFELAEPHGKDATGSLKIVIPAMAEPREKEFLFLFPDHYPELRTPLLP